MISVLWLSYASKKWKTRNGIDLVYIVKSISTHMKWRSLSAIWVQNAGQLSPGYFAFLYCVAYLERWIPVYRPPLCNCTCLKLCFLANKPHLWKHFRKKVGKNGIFSTFCRTLLHMLFERDLLICLHFLNLHIVHTV